MYKYIIVAVCLVLWAGPMSLQAQTLPQGTVDMLLKEIARLRSELAKLIVQNDAAPAPGATCLDLTHSLMIGSVDATTNGEVSKLQKFLSDAGMYPEAQITGYYGTLTAQAVERWQKAHGMDFVTVTSGVGPMTRDKMRCQNVSKAAIEKINWTIKAANPEITDDDNYRKYEQDISIDVIRADKSSQRYTVGRAYGCTGSHEQTTVGGKKVLGKVDCYYSLTGVTFTAILNPDRLIVEKFADDASGKTKGATTTVLTVAQ